MYARFGFLGAVILAAALAACGGGGGGGGGTPPTASPTPAGPSVSVSFGGSATTASLPVAPGTSYGGTITFAAGSGAGVMVASTAVPSGVSVLNVVSRSATAPNAKTRVRTQASSAPYNAVSYITLTASSAVALTSSSTTITATPSSGYDVAYYDAQGFWVSLPVGGPFTLAANGTAYFAVYTGGTLPSPNPAGCVGVQPNAATRANPQLVGVQPITPVAGFTYTGTLTQTIARATPCAIPNATSNASVTVTVTTSPGTGSQVHEDSVESDAYATQTVTTKTDATVEATTSPAAQSFAELSETTTDEVGDSTVTTYGTAPLIYAIGSPLPYTGTITNGPPATINATLADGTTTKRTYAANGTYTESDTIPGGGTNTITVNADGSGSYNIDGGSMIFSYAAPANGAIVLTVNPGASAQTLSIPAWFANNPQLYGDTMTDKGAGALPTPCNPNPSVPSADDFHRAISFIDPVLGYTENETIDAYVVSGSPTVGPACVVISDVVSNYYDYNFDTPYVIYASLQSPAAPMQTTTIDEAYWYSAAPTGTASSTRATAASLGGERGLGASIAAHASGITFQRTLERARQIETLTRNFALHHPGGVK